MADLTPIPTDYKGHVFRSRLEARWAVFFDALDIEWHYENEGYDLDGTRYLPDFWLPHLGIFIEIKPSVDWFYNEKCQALAVKSGHSVFHLAGDPWPGAYRITVYYSSGICTGGDLYRFALGRRDDRELWYVTDDAWNCINPITDDDRLPYEKSPRLMEAYRAARSARFEHGESGRTR